MSVNERRKLSEIPPPELDRLLGHFYCKVRKADGSTYEPDSLTAFQRSIDRHLTKDLHKTYSVIRDVEFASSREKLKAACKKLKKDGKGNKSKASEPLENSEVQKMWEKGALGDESPEVLQNTVWYLLTLHMGMRGRDEHYKLKYGDLNIHTTDEGYKYVEFNERDTKTRSGESSASRPFSPKMWSTPQNNQQCPVRIYEKYLQKRPPQMCEPDSPFYLAVNYKPSPANEYWYKQQKMGKERIGNIMKRMAAAADITGKKTNHSARKTMITALTKNDVPETQIMQLSGHTNVQSLNSYKKASINQQKKMSHVLSSYTEPKETSTENAPLQRMPLREVPEVSGYQAFLSGAHLTGCTINFGFPRSSSQQNIAIQHK